MELMDYMEDGLDNVEVVWDDERIEDAVEM